MYKFFTSLKNLRPFKIFTVASTILICYTACSVLPPVNKVHPGNIDTKGVLFMLPKAELYVSFAKYKTDSVKGIIAGYPKLIDKLNTLYFPEIKSPVRTTCSYYNYNHFLFTEKYIQDTSEMYSVKISKNKKHFFTNLTFAFSLSDLGMIESTDMTAENQSVAIFATIADFASSAIIPHLPGIRGTRGVSDTTQFNIATKLLDSLRIIKYYQRKINSNPKINDYDLQTSQYILDKLVESEDRILNALVGSSKTTLIDSLTIPVPLNKDSLYIIETKKHGIYSYTTLTGTDGQNSDYIFKIQPVWLTSFKNNSEIKKTTGMPYKMPEHVLLNVYNSYNELYATSDIIVPSKSTFYLPNKMGALKSQLSIEYNPNGTIKTISSGYTSVSQADVQALLDHYSASHPPPVSSDTPSSSSSPKKK